MRAHIRTLWLIRGASIAPWTKRAKFSFHWNLSSVEQRLQSKGHGRNWPCVTDNSCYRKEGGYLGSGERTRCVGAVLSGHKLRAQIKPISRAWKRSRGLGGHGEKGSWVKDQPRVELFLLLLTWQSPLGGALSRKDMLFCPVLKLKSTVKIKFLKQGESHHAEHWIPLWI